MGQPRFCAPAFCAPVSGCNDQSLGGCRAALATATLCDMTTTSPAVLAPTSLTARSIAPDLARGAMLLFIAIANAPWYLWGATTRDLSAHPVDGSPLDRVVQTISLIAVDGRAYPMFAVLFGYGIWQLYSRQTAAGVAPKDARRLLRRRHWWMLAFGAVHAALLWAGDVVGAYGLAGLVLVWLFLKRSNRTLAVWSIVFGSLVTIGAVFMFIVGPFIASSPERGDEFALTIGVEDPNYLASVATRLGAWLFITPMQGLVTLIAPLAILLAILAARHQLLERPELHLPLLRRIAVAGIAIGWTGGAVVAMQNLDLWGMPSSADMAFSGIQSVTGLCCGIGYVALFGLIAARLAGRPSGTVSGALQAVGKRSLSSYLAQSVLFAPILSAWGFGLGAALSSWSVTLFAIAVWFVTVLLAVALERAGRRGPAEWALRELVYPRRAKHPAPVSQPG